MKIAILCVCTGNTCRSPMLAGLLAAALAKAGVQARIESAGTGASAGEPATDGARMAMAQRGLDLSAHRSRALVGMDLDVFDRVYAVSSRHAAFVRAQGVPPERIHVLAAERGGIADPFGGDQSVYDACANELAAEAQRIASELGAPRRT